MNAPRPILPVLAALSLALAAVSILVPAAAASPCTNQAPGTTCVGYCHGRDAMCDNQGGNIHGYTCLWLGPTSPPLTPCTNDGGGCGGPDLGCFDGAYTQGYDAECIIGPGLTTVTCHAFSDAGPAQGHVSCWWSAAPTPNFPTCLPVSWCPGMFPAPPATVGVVASGTPVCEPVPSASLCPGMNTVPPTQVGVEVGSLFLCVPVPSVVACPGMRAIPPTEVGVVYNGSPLCVPVPDVQPCPGMLAVLPTEVGVIVGGTPVCVPFHVPTVGLCPGMLPPPPTAVGVVIDGTPYCFLMPSIGFCQDPFGITVPPPPGSIGVVVNGFPVCVP